jgi:maltooligosyltrehalose trehalohydrolase
MERKLPGGAELASGGGAHFRVWAPASKTAAVTYPEQGRPAREFVLEAETGGYFSGFDEKVRAGSLYRFKLDSGSFPDPFSRYQPEGPHGPSQIVDPSSFAWSDGHWKGLPVEQLVIYELHLGTFTPEGTWRSAMRQLAELKRIGITLIEIMPIADFCGRFGWGYDGVNLFAPCRLYGSPDDARAFINKAHELGMMVILDVVYNHLGPDGNYLHEFSKDYFSSKYACEWGEALNFDGANAKSSRVLFVSNARYWIDEYHFDGLRLDATQQIFDDSELHILAEITQAAQEAGKGRQIYIVGENEPQNTRLVRSREQGGYGLSALWNDDFHHSAMVCATGKAEAYYADYRGKPQEFISSLKYGYLYQGQFYRWQKKRRGTPAFDLLPIHFVTFLQNHDQIANSIRGQRLHQITSPGKLRALTGLSLLAPSTPMLFMGEEFAASAPFLFFADHNPKLNKLISQGRRQFLNQFRSSAASECDQIYAEPGDEKTFLRCKLDFAEREKHRPIYQLHIDLLQLRHHDASLNNPARLDGAVLAADGFVLRFFSRTGDDRLLIVNLGVDLNLNPAPEPLLAPLEGRGWKVLWSSEAPAYGGWGTPPLETQANWMIPGHAAVLLSPDENDELPIAKLSQND